MSTLIVVTPNFMRVVKSVPTGAALAERIDRATKRAHGQQAGADCYLVRIRDGRADFRGMFAGRHLIGQRFACGDGIARRALDWHQAQVVATVGGAS